MLFPERMLDPAVPAIGVAFPVVAIWLVFPLTRKPPELEKLCPILHGHLATSWGPGWGKTGSSALVLENFAAWSDGPFDVSFQSYLP